MIKKTISCLIAIAMLFLTCNPVYAEENETYESFGKYITLIYDDFYVSVTDNLLNRRIDIDTKEEKYIISGINNNKVIEAVNASCNYELSIEDLEKMNNIVIENMTDEYNLVFSDGIEVINSTVLNREIIKSLSICSSCRETGRWTFINMSELSEATIYSADIELAESGLGYIYDENKNTMVNPNLVIKGYKNSTAETYAIENGITFVPLDDPVTEVTTSAPEEVITESTTTQPVITDSVTQQSQSTVITDAASAKVNSTPKTGEKNIYGIIALGISAAVLSVVSSAKKQNRNN